MNQAELEASIVFHEHEMNIEPDNCPAYTERCEAEEHEENKWHCWGEWHSFNPRQCFTCYLELTGEEHG